MSKTECRLQMDTFGILPTNVCVFHRTHPLGRSLGQLRLSLIAVIGLKIVHFSFLLM